MVNPLPGDEDKRGRLAIPYITPIGVVDIRFRAIGDATPKYLGMPGSVTRLYNVTALHMDSDVVAVCEGEMDTITMHALVGVPAVGVPGANNWKTHYRIPLQGYGQVFVMCDGDQAGREFGKKVAREVDNAVIVHMPDGMDVNSAYQAHGPGWVRERMGL